MSGFFGIIISSLQPEISSTSLSARSNASTSSINVSSTANKRGTLTYNWKRSGKTNNRINATDSATTTFTGLDTDDGTTVTYCDITDSVTGVTTTTPECVITWIAPPPQDVVISGTVTYTGSVQAYTLTGTPATPAPSGITSTFIDAGTYVYPTNITSITTDSSYKLGTVSGSFIISPATLTASTRTGSATFNGISQTIAVLSGINGTYTGSTSVSGINAGSYTTTITGTVNHTGSVTGTLTISPATLTASTRTGSATFNGGSQTVAVLSGINGTYTGSTSVSGTNAGSYTTTITGTGNYGGTVTGTLTISPATLTALTSTGSATFSGSSQTVAVLSGINGTYTGSTSVSGINAGSYTTTITGTGNYGGTVTGILTISPATLTATGTTGSATYTGSSQAVTVLSGINGTFSGSTSVSGINAGSYTTTITGTGNYTGSVTGILTISPATLTATGTTGSATFNGGSQTVTVLSGINGAYTGSASVSGINAGSYTTTITGTGNHTGSVTGTLTIGPATLAASTTTSPYAVYNKRQQSFTISGINGTYTGNPAVSGTNAGSYSTTIYGTGNYTGSVTGTLTIYQDVGYVDIFYGGVHDASRTSSIFVPVRTSNAAFTVTHSVSGPGAADAQYTSYGLNSPYDWNMLYDPVPPGTVVRNTNPYTQGFVVTITAAINDPNYGFMSSTTSVTVNAYVAPSGGGGFIVE